MKHQNKCQQTDSCIICEGSKEIEKEMKEQNISPKEVADETGIEFLEIKNMIQKPHTSNQDMQNRITVFLLNRRYRNARSTRYSN